MRVLVIEDDDDVTLLYRLALEHAGHEVEAVALGEQGVRVAGDHRPDVILLDGMLPDIDGLVVLDQLRADPATAGIPVVMASARVGGTDRRAALERGATAYVMKPFQPGDIADLVARLGAPREADGDAPTNGTPRDPAPAAAAAGAHANGAPSQRATARLGDAALIRLLNLAHDAIVSIDAEQRIIGFNKGAEHTFGYLAEQVLGKPLSLLLPEGKAQEHLQRVPHLHLAPGTSLDMGAGGYVYGRRRDGSTFPVEASVTNVDIDGHTVLTAIVRDATDRQRVEAELQARIAQQVALADLSLRAITEDDMSALFEDAVATVARVLHVDLVNLSVIDAPTAELVLAAGHGWSSTADLAPRCSTEPGSLGAATLASDGPLVFDDVTDDGRFSAPPHLVAQGVTSGVHVALRGRARAVGLLGIYSRTRRRFTEDDVHAVRAIANVVASAVQRDNQNRRVRAFLDAAPDATLIVSSAGAIVSANAQSEVLFGYSREELLRLSVDMLVPEGARARHSAHRADYETDRQPRPMGEDLELSARRKDGTQVPVDIMLRPVDTDEGPLVVAAVRDITDRRRNEAARDAFLHAVSHELRTPLTSVLGFSALLLDRYGDELSPDALDLARRIRASGGKLERLLGDMLDLDRLGRGVLEARRSLVALRAVVDRALEAVELEGRHLSVVVDPEDLHASVDPIQVERILENLIVNAVRHTPPTASVWVRVSQSANGILLVVEDDGPGVPAESQGEIFEPFRRGPGVVAPGTGIGLSLVARFAELHGGRAWVEERAGGGSSFRVVLAT